MSSGVILLQRPYISFSSPLLLFLRQEITAAAVALFSVRIQIFPFGDTIHQNTISSTELGLVAFISVVMVLV